MVEQAHSDHIQFFIQPKRKVRLLLKKIKRLGNSPKRNRQFPQEKYKGALGARLEKPGEKGQWMQLLHWTKRVISPSVYF